MRKIILLALSVLVACSFGGCEKNAVDQKGLTGQGNGTEIISDNGGKTETKKQLSAAELDSLLGALPITVESSKYVVQHAEYKALYPDMLRAIIKNNSQSDIKNVVVAFVGWDTNALPVKIKGRYDFGDATSYIKNCNFNDINLIPGATFGDGYGMEVDETCNIESVKAFIMSYETFEGEKWENPYKKLIERMYETGVKLSDGISIEVKENELHAG